MTQPESDLSSVRDQIARRIWDMTQISLQGPGYAKGYADGLSEGLVLIDKVLINPYLSKLIETRKNLEKFKINLENLTPSNFDEIQTTTHGIIIQLDQIISNLIQS